MINYTAVVEDVLTENILNKIASYHSKKINIESVLIKKGNTEIKPKIISYNQATLHGVPFIVLTDLDANLCAPMLIKKWTNNIIIDKFFLFRVVEKSIESWVMADRESFSNYFKIPLKKIPMKTDDIVNPKSFLIDLVRNHCHKNFIDDIVPKYNHAKQGPNYNDCLGRFVSTKWNLKNAIIHSKSLNRFNDKLKQL